MKSQEQIEQEVMKTLACFEQQTPIESNPFFTTRVMARIRELEGEKRARSVRMLFSVRMLRPIFFALIIALNLGAMILIWRGNQPQSDMRTQYLTAFADEYALNQQEYDPFNSERK